MSHDLHIKTIDIQDKLCYIINNSRGGDCIYVLIFIIFSILLTHYIVRIYDIKVKSKFILDNNTFSQMKFKFLETNFQKYKVILTNLDNPYGINFLKFKLLKCVISPIVFILVFYRFNNWILSLIYFLCFFYLPNFLIYIYTKNESFKIINDISEISNNLRLALSCNIPLNESLKYVKSNIKQKRFKKSFEVFTNDYLMYNFNITKAVDNFKLKFKSYEFNMFLNIFVQGEKEGKMVESLTIFCDTLELSYFKYLKYNEAKRVLFVTISAIFSLINILILTIYPIVIQISENLQNIFN